MKGICIKYLEINTEYRSTYCLPIISIEVTLHIASRQFARNKEDVFKLFVRVGEILFQILQLSL